MITSRKIEDLDLKAQTVCQQHIDECAKAGIDLLITATYRDTEAQDALYQIGRNPGDLRARVTNAKGGQSWHQFKVAWDIVPVIGGKCVWNDKLLWTKIITLGIAVGAEAGANWKSFPDKPHFQLAPKEMTIDQAATVFKQHGTLFV